MISKYNSFLENRILDLINDSYIYYSPDLESVLVKTGGDIASDLLKVMSTDIKDDITFVNLDKDGYLSFTTSRNASANLSKMWTNTKPEEWFISPLAKGDIQAIWDRHSKGDENDVYSKSRSSIKIGRLVNKIFPGKYNDKQVEDFVNLFKATIENSKERFEIVEGDDVAHWYHSNNYLSKNGTLGNSCMSAKSKSVFDIYVKNPEVCKMLILREGDKIKGRALIWKLNSIKANSEKFNELVKNCEYFMDRQYTILESDVIKFRNYAIDKGWAYKTNNNHYSLSDITFNGKVTSVEMCVQLKEISYSNFPYVDTFRRYNPDSYILTNDNETEDNYGNYILDDTGGSYTEIEDSVYSEWSDCDIPRDRAIWSNHEDSWIYRSDAVEITMGNARYHGWHHEDCDQVRYSSYYDAYLHEYDSTYSSYYDTYILDDDSILCVESIDIDGEPSGSDCYLASDDTEKYIEISEISKLQWYDVFMNKWSRWEDFGGILSTNLTKNNNGEYIPKNIEVKVYFLAHPNMTNYDNSEWLDEIDAGVLGLEIDKDNSKTIDYVEYYSSFKSMDKNLIDGLDKLDKELYNEAKELSSKRDSFDRSVEIRTTINIINKKKTILEIVSVFLD